MEIFLPSWIAGWKSCQEGNLDCSLMDDNGYLREAVYSKHSYWLCTTFTSVLGAELGDSMTTWRSKDGGVFRKWRRIKGNVRKRCRMSGSIGGCQEEVEDGRKHWRMSVRATSFLRLSLLPSESVRKVNCPASSCLPTHYRPVDRSHLKALPVSIRVSSDRKLKPCLTGEGDIQVIKIINRIVNSKVTVVKFSWVCES